MCIFISNWKIIDLFGICGIWWLCIKWNMCGCGLFLDPVFGSIKRTCWLITNGTDWNEVVRRAFLCGWCLNCLPGPLARLLVYFITVAARWGGGEVLSKLRDSIPSGKCLSSDCLYWILRWGLCGMSSGFRIFYIYFSYQWSGVIIIYDF